MVGTDNIFACVELVQKQRSADAWRRARLPVAPQPAESIRITCIGIASRRPGDHQPEFEVDYELSYCREAETA
jgi:hypothetical protein